MDGECNVQEDFTFPPEYPPQSNINIFSFLGDFSDAVYFPLHNFYFVYDLKNSKLLRVTESRVVDILIDDFKGQFDIGRTLKLSKDHSTLFVSIEDKKVRWYYDISSLNFS